MRLIRSAPSRRSTLVTLGLASTLCAAAPAPAQATNIVYVCGNNLCEVTSDGNRVTHVTRDGTRNRPYVHPSQTRDGSRLAFMHGSVMHVRDRGKRRRRIMKFPVDGLLIHPRGRFLLWNVHLDAQGVDQVCRKKLGRKLQPCTLSQSGVPSWGGGVRALLNEDDEPPHEVGLYEWTKREVNRIRTVARLSATGSQLASRPALSPDGRFVAVSVAIGGTREIRIGLFRARTGRRVRWVTRGHHDVAPTWSPDGHQLAFLRARKPKLDEPTPRRTTLWTVDRSGDGPRRIVDRAVPQAFWAG